MCSAGTDWSEAHERVPRTVVPDALAASYRPLSDRLPVAVGASLAPILLTSLLLASYAVTTDGGSEFPRAVVDVAYGVAALTVLASVWLVLDETEWRAAAPFETPGRTELVWTAVCFPLAVAAFLLGSGVAEQFGFAMSGFDYSLRNPATLAAVVFGGVLVAPLVEEVVFRGLLFGSLVGRGHSPVVAGLVSILVFAGVHVIALGVAGVVAIAAWSVFPTLLRIRFDDLTGAWLLHACNNVFSYLVVVWFGVA